jgi:hypothetical protein
LRKIAGLSLAASSSGAEILDACRNPKNQKNKNENPNNAHPQHLADRHIHHAPTPLTDRIENINLVNVMFGQMVPISYSNPPGTPSRKRPS